MENPAIKDYKYKANRIMDGNQICSYKISNNRQNLKSNMQGVWDNETRLSHFHSSNPFASNNSLTPVICRLPKFKKTTEIVNFYG